MVKRFGCAPMAGATATWMLDCGALQVQSAQQLSVRSDDDGGEAHCDCASARRAPKIEYVISGRQNALDE